MPQLLGPQFNSMGYTKKTKKQRDAEKKAFEEQYERDMAAKAENTPKFSSKQYGSKPAPARTLKRVSKIPSYKAPEGRGNNRHIESVVDPSAPAMVIKRSPMDPRELAKEPEHVREATIAKSQSIAPMYNKGGDQFLTPGIDVTTIGSRSRRP